MGKNVTLGGERVGTGEKFKQYLHGYERSNHNLSYQWKSSMAPGVLTPFLSLPMQPADKFEIDLSADVLTHPTVGPLFGSFKLQLDVFTIPIRLYQAQLHNNKVDIGLAMNKIKLPLMEVATNNIDISNTNAIPIDLQQINPSSLLAYLGLKGNGQGKTPNQAGIIGYYNAIPLLGYWDTYKNYYANKQEEIGMMIDYQKAALEEITEVHYTAEDGTDIPEYGGVIPATGTTKIEINGSWLERGTIELGFDALGGTWWYSLDSVIENVKETDGGSGNIIKIEGDVRTSFKGAGTRGWRITSDIANVDEPEITQFPLSAIDDMREDILAAIKEPNAFTINDQTYAPYGNIFKGIIEADFPKIRSYLPLEGLALKTYQSDKFNNWLQTEWIDGDNGISAVTAVDVTDGYLKIDGLNIAKKVYNMLNRIAISGGTYMDWISTVWDEDGYISMETPVYQGGLSKEIVFQEVISNSQSEGEPLGTLAGRGVVSQGQKGGKMIVKVSEPSYILGLVSITPRIVYSQGNEWDLNLRTMDDFHKPALDGIGFQDLITDGMAAWDTKRGYDGNDDPEFRTIGKQPAWINYMTNVDKVYGHFADSRSEMFMVLNRNYEIETEGANKGIIKDATTYIDPAKYNYIFAQADRSAQNFWTYINVKIDARRKMSAKQIPTV